MEPKAESKEEFFERSFEETEDGFYDERGFFTTPNGSFWDDERVYFNHLGFDKHGGTYDKYGIYLPGPNWNEEYNCYNDELDKNQDTDKAYSQVLDNINDTSFIYMIFQDITYLVHQEAQTSSNNRTRCINTEYDMFQTILFLFP